MEKNQHRDNDDDNNNGDSDITIYKKGARVCTMTPPLASFGFLAQRNNPFACISSDLTSLTL